MFLPGHALDAVWSVPWPAPGDTPIHIVATLYKCYPTTPLSTILNMIFFISRTGFVFVETYLFRAPESGLKEDGSVKEQLGEVRLLP